MGLYKNVFDNCYKKNERNKGNQYPDTSSVMFTVQFNIFSIGVDQCCRKHDNEQKRKDQLTFCEHIVIFMQN